jgi:hypothetical protein
MSQIRDDRGEHDPHRVAPVALVSAATAPIMSDPQRRGQRWTAEPLEDPRGVTRGPALLAPRHGIGSTPKHTGSDLRRLVRDRIGFAGAESNDPRGRGERNRASGSLWPYATELSTTGRITAQIETLAAFTTAWIAATVA